MRAMLWVVTMDYTLSVCSVVERARRSAMKHVSYYICKTTNRYPSDYLVYFCNFLRYNVCITWQCASRAWILYDGRQPTETRSQAPFSLHSIKHGSPYPSAYLYCTPSLRPFVSAFDEVLGYAAQNFSRSFACAHPFIPMII